MHDLRELQRAFLDSIASASVLDGDAPPGEPAREGPQLPALLARLVEGRGALGPADRVAIYARMYQARLLDVLADDFPKLAAILGHDRFRALCRAYLAAHPSRHPSLRHLGSRLPGFVACLEPASDLGRVCIGLPFLAELARLEWARSEVFDAPDADVLRLEELRRVAPESWPDLTFRPVAALAVIESAWPIDDIWRAAEASETAPAHLVEKPSTVRIWRDGFTVLHATVDVSERAALRSMQGGASFAAMCDQLCAFHAADEAPAVAAGIVLRWIEDEILDASSLPLDYRTSVSSRPLGS
jgi:hypothetical protein